MFVYILLARWHEGEGEPESFSFRLESFFGVRLMMHPVLSEASASPSPSQVQILILEGRGEGGERLGQGSACKAGAKAPGAARC